MSKPGRSPGAAEPPPQADEVGPLNPRHHHAPPVSDHEPEEDERDQDEGDDEDDDSADAPRRSRSPLGRGAGAPRSRWKRETRFGLAALLSFLILVSVLIVNKGKKPSPASGKKGGAPPTVAMPNPSDPGAGAPDTPPTPEPGNDAPSNPPLPQPVQKGPDPNLALPPAQEIRQAGGENEGGAPPSPGTLPIAANDPPLPTAAPDSPADRGEANGPGTALPEPAPSSPAPGTLTAQDLPPEPASAQVPSGPPPATEATPPSEATPLPPVAATPPELPITPPSEPAPISLPSVPDRATPPTDPGPPPATTPALATTPTGLEPPPVEATPSPDAPARAKKIPDLTAPPPSSLGDPAPTAGPPDIKPGTGVPVPNVGKVRPLDDLGSRPAAIGTAAAGTAAAVGPRSSGATEVDRGDWIPHIVARGENFWTISRLYYRSGRYYKALWMANRDLVPQIEKLYIGTTIRIPPPEALDKAQIDPPRVARPAPTDPGTPVRRTSRSAPSAEVASAAALRSREVELSVPVNDSFVRPSRRPEPDDALDPPPEERARASRRLYRVRPGENLRSIARATLGDSKRYREILELNREIIDDPFNLVPGQQIEIPEGARPGRMARRGGLGDEE